MEGERVLGHQTSYDPDHEIVPGLKLGAYCDLCKIVVNTDSYDPQTWLKAQKLLMSLKNEMENDYSIIDPVNPFRDKYFKEKDPGEFDNNTFFLQLRELYDVTQVAVWILNEYYAESWHIPDPTERAELFQSLIFFINAHHQFFLDDRLNLLRNICKLAGRLCRVGWNDSKVYEDSIQAITEGYYSDTEFELTSILMIYFKELMLEMQRKVSSVDTKTFRIIYMTDIFIASFQYFDETRRKFLEEKLSRIEEQNPNDISITTDGDIDSIEGIKY